LGEYRIIGQERERLIDGGERFLALSQIVERRRQCTVSERLTLCCRDGRHGLTHHVERGLSPRLQRVGLAERMTTLLRRVDA